MPDDAYKPDARDSIVAYFGRNRGSAALRTHCVTCCDAHPLTGDRAGEAPHKIYGDLFVPDGPEGSRPDDERCDICDVPILDLSRQCQQEHDDQQARWARTMRVEFVSEMGALASVRCRVY